MPKSSFSALHVAQPERKARDLERHRQRIAVLKAGVTPSKWETVEEHERIAARVEQAFREHGICQLRGCPLEDPLSVWRGYGPKCWDKLTPARRAEAEARATELAGPWRGEGAFAAAQAALAQSVTSVADSSGRMAGAANTAAEAAAALAERLARREGGAS